jgi:hypothetical protein
MTAAANPAKEYMPLPMEALGDEWKEVNYPRVAPGYHVSLYGEVRSPRGKILKPNVQSGNLWVSVMLDDTRAQGSVRVDRLVLSAFEHYEPYLTPDHIDDDGQNCQLVNLRWREPTPTEEAALKAQVARRANQAKKKPVKKAVPAEPEVASRGEVEVMRIYRHGGLTIPVSPAGEIPAKALPQGKLSAAKVASLAKILTRIDEMNVVMGVGR